MADIEAIEVLTQAKERLFECGWGTGVWEERTPAATLCLEEALVGQQGSYVPVIACDDHDRAVRRSEHFIQEAIGHPFQHLFMWNDRECRSAGDVFDAIDRAIEIAKEAPKPASS